jgi:hypothetical protein
MSEKTYVMAYFIESMSRKPFEKGSESEEKFFEDFCKRHNIDLNKNLLIH